MTEETTVDLREAHNADLKGAGKARDAADQKDADATEADVSETDLDQEEQEKEPMTSATADGDAAASSPAAVEKNGAVKLKIPEEDKEISFTGLSKEELLRVAGTPGWVRTRWALLVLFWLCWVGMLGGAVLIIMRAPRCKDLPQIEWWSEGPLFQIGDVQAFSESGNLEGVKQKLDSLAQLKVKGLVIGPIHVAPPDEPMNLRFDELSPESGTIEQFRELLQLAQKKGMSIVLDLTPNYQGSSGPWYSNSSVTMVAERLKSALVFWLNYGVDGIQLSGVESVESMVPSLWSDIRAIVQNGTMGGKSKKRVLIGVSKKNLAEDVSGLLSSAGVDLLISGVLRPGDPDSIRLAQSIQVLYSSHNQTNLAWSLGSKDEGHLASLVGMALVKLHQLLLLTLPGTPIFNYGDDIGLLDKDNKFPKMLWDTDDDLNGTLQEREQQQSCRSFFQETSKLRSKERSLLFGDFSILFNSSSSMAYLRAWDQSERYVAAFNWAEEEVEMKLRSGDLPKQAVVALSTNDTSLSTNSHVGLASLRIGPGQAVLLKFPYKG